MKAQETTFRQLVGGEKQFQIPLYQRTYSWGVAQLRQLWSDIVEQAQALQSRDDVGSHFIGSTVLAPSPATMPTINRWLVVDGQQRLTTLMLALAAIRDHPGTTPRDRERIQKLYLTNEFQSGDGYYRLLPTRADREAFCSCIAGAPAAGGPGKVGEAYRFFAREIAAADDPADPHDIDRIESVILERLTLVEIVAHADDNVYRIFESLNNTGLSLTQADLVRNLIFMLLPTRGEFVYDNAWLPIQERLGDSLADLFYLHLVLRGQDRLRRDEIYVAMQRELAGSRGDEGAIEALVRELGRKSLLLEKIIDPRHEDDHRVRAALRRLNVWRAQAAQPVLLYLLDLRDRGLSSSDEVATAVSYVESFLVRRMICGVPTNNLNRIFNAAVQELPRDVGVAEGLRFVLSGERRFWPTDAELREAILSKPFYWQGRAEQRRLVLQRLEESYGSREPIDWTAALSIEHVLPQTPSEEWLTSLASDVREGESTLDVHRRLVHTLGNLTLTGYNPVLSNGLFDQKKELLRKSGLHMNQRIAEATSWGPAEVKARGEELTEHAIRLWPGPVPVAPRVDRDWTLLHQALAALPPGSWTTYGDLAALIGSHPVPVGSHISTTPVPNAHRVLDASGRVVQGFHWLDPADQRDPAQMLRDEGVIFDEVGRADPAQRMVTQELAALVNLDVSEPSDLPNGVRSSATEDSESRQRFLRQLDGRGPQIAAAVQRLMETWIRMGGRYRFGPSAEITCALVCGGTTQPVWPMIVYPSTASIEVSFKPVSKRPPFDESPMRLEFLSRLNQAPGVAIPAAKIDLYPTFQCSVLLQQEAFDAIADALRWFIEQVNAHGAQPAGGTSADDA